MQNADLRQLIFYKIKSLGYKITNIAHPDGYFICDYGKDSITHFNLKGHLISKHWRFGLWVEEKYFDPAYVEKCRTEYNMKNENMHVIQLFAQWDTSIDKFKPSRSALCLSWDLDDINAFIDGNDKDYQGNSYTFNKIEQMLGFMCKHPLLAYEEFCGECAGYYNGSFLGNFIKYEGYYYWKKIKKALCTAIWLPYTKAKCLIAGHSKLINKIELFNFEKEHPGLSTSYLYELNIRFNEDVTDDQANKLLNKWFHRKNYGEFGYYDYVIQVDKVTQAGSDEVWFYG